MELPNGSVANYKYDAFGRRVEKQVVTDSGSATTEFVWQGDKLIAESSDSSYQSYIYELGSFKPLALVKGEGVDSQVYYYHLDQIGTPTDITNATGQSVWSVQYRAYGNVLKQHIEEVVNPLRFQGQYYDAETGLHYNRHRYYSPNSGRFITADPIGLAGGLNNYQYVVNPTGWVDPLGLSNTPGSCPGSTDSDSQPEVNGEESPPQTTFKAAFRQAKRNLGIPKNVNTPPMKKVWDNQYENRTVWEFEGEHKGKFIVLHADDKLGRGKHLHTATSLEGRVDPTQPGKYNQHKGHIPEDYEGFVD